MTLGLGPGGRGPDPGRTTTTRWTPTRSRRRSTTDRACRPLPDRDRRDDRHDVVDVGRPGRGDRRRSRRARACGCTSMPRMPGRSRSCPSAARPFAGWERADSIVVNPHKWLFTPLDASLLLTRRMDAAARGVQPRARVPADARPRRRPSATTTSTRRSSAGGSGRSSCGCSCAGSGWRGCGGGSSATSRWPQRSPAWVDADPDWERLAPVPFSTVCFRWRPAGCAAVDEPRPLDDRERARSWTRSTAPARCSCRTPGCADRFTIRLAVGNLRTEERHVERAWELLRARPPRRRRDQTRSHA